MINKAVIQGRLVRDPELRHTQNGKSVCSFTIAWNTKVGDKEEKLFLNCTAWNRTADNVSKWFKKGQEAVVVGSLKTKQWEDNQGNKRQSNDLTVSEISFCGPKMETYESYAYTKDGGDGDDFTDVDLPDELPF